MQSRESIPRHEPLSQSLSRILEGESVPAALTVNLIIERTQGRGIYFVLILLSLPFVAWVSIPGMSTVLGPMIGILAVRLAFEKTPRLPASLGDRKLPPKLKNTILGGGLKFCRALEKVVRPRRTRWMTWRIARLGHALLIVFMALLLALPLPSPPFLGSNALPAYSIILLAVSMMEEDGVMIWIGYLASLAAALYFVLLGGIIVKHLATWFHKLLELLHLSQ